MKRIFPLLAVLLSAALNGEVATAAPPRGYIDCRWNAGYRRCTSGLHECGRFDVCPGCSGLVPQQYRAFNNIVLPSSTPESVGYSWYAAGHGYGLPDSTIEFSSPAEAIPAPTVANE